MEPRSLSRRATNLSLEVAVKEEEEEEEEGVLEFEKEHKL